jgi:hypothetical protein
MISPSFASLNVACTRPCAGWLSHQMRAKPCAGMTVPVGTCHLRGVVAASLSQWPLRS